MEFLHEKQLYFDETYTKSHLLEDFWPGTFTKKYNTNNLAKLDNKDIKF